jgi:hypothetical protein
MCEIKRQDASHKWQHPANTFKLKALCSNLLLRLSDCIFSTHENQSQKRRVPWKMGSPLDVTIDLLTSTARRGLARLSRAVGKTG